MKNRDKQIKYLNLIAKRRDEVGETEKCICCGNYQFIHRGMASYGFCNCDDNYGTKKCKHYKLKNSDKFKKY